MNSDNTTIFINPNSRNDIQKWVGIGVGVGVGAAEGGSFGPYIYYITYNKERMGHIASVAPEGCNHHLYF